MPQSSAARYLELAGVFREMFLQIHERLLRHLPYPGGFNPWISNVTEYTSPHVTDERQIPDTVLNPRFQTGPGPGGWSTQGRRSTSGGGFARVPNLRVRKHLLSGVAHARRER